MDRGYRLTCYRAGPIEARIGRPSASADAWLARHRAATAVLITAWNPMSHPMSEAWNARAHARLLGMLAKRPRAEGFSGTPDWQEWTVAVVGTDRLGRRLSRLFRQRAYILLRRRRPALLVYPRRPDPRGFGPVRGYK
jgi:hypothetical protein